MSLRSVLFWIHLGAGVIAGVIILILSVTGAAIAFEKELIAWSERGQRTVKVPASPAERLSIDTLLDRFHAEFPGQKASGVTVFAAPSAAVQISVGRTNGYYVNPYTGAFQAQSGTLTRNALRFLTDWHRWLGRDGEGRAVGKAVTGAANTAFLFLAVSGLYLWWPRQWTRAVWRGSAVLNVRLRGRARDWNWHNAVGFWSAPVLIVLTASGMIISYRWASDLVYRAFGETPPAASAGPGSRAGSGGAPVNAAPVSADSGVSAAGAPLTREALLQHLAVAVPQWEQMTLRLDAGRPRGAGAARDAADPGAPAGSSSGAGAGERAREAKRGGEGTKERGSDRPLASANISLRERGMWPLFGAHQYTLDPVSGAVLRRETYADFSTGRKARTWLRFLHTGEALGLPGKAIAAAGSLAGALLVWTGLALAWRRLRAWQQRRSPPANGSGNGSDNGSSLALASPTEKAT